MKPTWLMMAVVLAPAGCQAGSGGLELIELRGSLRQLRERFNAEKDRPRAVALLSPA